MKIYQERVKLMEDKKAYRWSGAVNEKCLVKPIPLGDNELINFAIKKSKTYRDDMDGFSYTFYSDAPFEVYISDGNNTIAHLHSEEIIKYWYSTPEDAIEMARVCINETSIKAYYIYKRFDNFYEMFTNEVNYSGELIEIINGDNQL